MSSTGQVRPEQLSWAPGCETGAWEGQVGNSIFTFVGLACSKACSCGTNYLGQRKWWRRENITLYSAILPQTDRPTTVGSGRQHCTNSPENVGPHCCICTKSKATTLSQATAVNPPQLCRAHTAHRRCCAPGLREAESHRQLLSPAATWFSYFVVCSWNAKIAEHSGEKFKEPVMDKLNFPGQIGEFWA